MKNLSWFCLVLLTVLLLPEWAFAQPSRSMPGTRPYLPGSPPINPAPLNTRTRAAASATGLESTDFYGKKGYPKVLGDSVEAQTTGGANGAGGTLTGGIAGGLTGGAGGAAGVGGATGGLSGGLAGGGGGFGGGGIAGFGILNGNPTNPTGITGGGFSGLGPKGFGFGGVPAFDSTSLRYFGK